MPAHVFLSYSQGDQQFANRVQATLESTGISVWRDIDPNRIHAGDQLWTVIEAALKSVGCVVLLLSRRSEQSESVKHEFALAQKHQVPVLPLMIDARSPVELEAWWRERLSNIRCESVVDNKFHDVIQKLINAAKLYADRRCPVIGLFNMKGGVGKTTLSLQLAARLNVNYNRKVLIVDADPQQNLTETILTKAELDNARRYNKSIIGLFEPNKINRELSVSEKISCDPSNSTPINPDCIPFRLHRNLISTRFDCIPSDMYSIKYTQLGGAAAFAYEMNFDRALEYYKKFYDYILVDCNPGVSFLTGVALKSCSNILIPIKPDTFAYSGFHFTEMVLKDFFGRHEEIEQGKLSITAVFNEISPVLNLKEKLLIQEMRSKFKFGNCLTNEIPHSKKLQIREEGALQPDEDDLLAEAIIRRTANGRAVKPLERMVDEYVRHIEGFHKLERRNH